MSETDRYGAPEGLGGWLARRLAARAEAKGRCYSVVSFKGDIHGFTRFEPFWPDERVDGQGRIAHRLPWWRPFNVLVHRWDSDVGYAEEFHDHPRWSVTICLAGEVVEETPWRARTLRPGSFTLRSHRFIHRLIVADEQHGLAWTLFIVGRRRHLQNTYVVKSQGGVSGQVKAPA